MDSSQNIINNKSEKEDNQTKIQLNETKYVEDDDPQPKSKCECEEHLIQVFKSFCSHTSLHGIQYVGEKGHIAVRFLWSIVVLLALGAAIYHICQVYAKWEQTPAMVTISPRVKDIDELYFPAVTICAPTQLLTKEFADSFLNKSHRRYKQRKDFVDTYCEKGSIPQPDNINYTSEDDDIWKKNTKLSCERIMEAAKYPDKTVTWKAVFPRYVTPIQALVQGVTLDCCTFNGMREDLMYKNLNISSKKYATKAKDMLTPTGIGTQNAFTYVIEGLQCIPKNAQFMVSIHHPAEAPNVEGDGLIVKPGGEISYAVKPLQTETSENLKYLKPKDRECQIYDDMPLQFFQNYTEWNCKLECLANMTIEKCHCLPSYLPVNDDPLNMPKCKKNGYFTCFNQLHSNFEHFARNSCKCEQSCSDVMYLVTTQYIPAETEEKNMVKFDVYFTESTFFSYERSEHLGLSEFLASCGGLLGVFMGFSFISMIEIFYFGIFGIWKAVFGTFVMDINSENK